MVDYKVPAIEGLLWFCKTMILEIDYDSKTCFNNDSVLQRSGKC